MMDEHPDIINDTLSIQPNHEDYPKPIIGQVTNLEVDQAEKELQHIAKHPSDDPNLDAHLIKDAEQALEAGDVKNEVNLADLIEEDSPYPEVRAAVSNVDDVDMPVFTARTVILGLITTIIVPGLNQFLSLRFPTSFVGPNVVTIISYSFGQMLSWCLPTKVWKTRWGNWTLNPGPFNVKEHTLINIMSQMSATSAYATDVLAVQRMHGMYEIPSWGYGYGILLVWSTQLVGLSFASVSRKFLVWQPSMIWPSVLPTCTLINSMHGIKSEGYGGGISRQKFFWIAFVVLFFYQFFPSYIFTMLSIGNWFCTIAPKNVVLNQILGTQSGLGLLPFTFDWTVITYAMSPLASPWWTQANALAGFVIFFVIVCPAMYYTNTWNAKYMPMFDSSSYDRFGQPYEVSKVIPKSNGLSPPVLDVNQYNNYSMIYLPSALTVSYFLSFASITAVLVHVGLFHGKSMWKQMRSSPADSTDVHMQLMSKYKEAPYWWYLVLFLGSFAMGIGAVEGWPTGLPWWGFIVAIVLGGVFFLPVGVIQALSNQQVGMNMISELIVGYMLPGRPFAMMIFKTTMYMATSQGLAFVSDQKIAHYMKLPPRAVFFAQIIATMVGGAVQLAVQEWSFNNIDGICHPDQKEKFTCSSQRVFGTASVIWGLIGPKNMFSIGKRYNSLLYGFLVGALVPIPIWLLAKKFPKSRFHLINTPVIFAATGAIPPATGVNYLSPIVVGFLTQYLWKRYQFKKWFKFNYILSAALDGASAISVVFIFFVLQYVHGSNPKATNQEFYNKGWWGNSAWQHTADYEGASLWTLPKHVGFEGTPNEIGQPHVS